MSWVFNTIDLIFAKYQLQQYLRNRGSPCPRFGQGNAARWSNWYFLSLDRENLCCFLSAVTASAAIFAILIVLGSPLFHEILYWVFFKLLYHQECWQKLGLKSLPSWFLSLIQEKVLFKGGTKGKSVCQTDSTYVP